MFYTLFVNKNGLTGGAINRALWPPGSIKHEFDAEIRLINDGGFIYAKFNG